MFALMADVFDGDYLGNNEDSFEESLGRRNASNLNPNNLMMIPDLDEPIEWKACDSESDLVPASIIVSIETQYQLAARVNLLKSYYSNELRLFLGLDEPDEFSVNTRLNTWVPLGNIRRRHAEYQSFLNLYLNFKRDLVLNLSANENVNPSAYTALGIYMSNVIFAADNLICFFRLPDYSFRIGFRQG